MWLAASFAAFVVAVAVHAIAMRARPTTNRVVSFVVVGGIAGCLLGSWSFAMFDWLSAQSIAAVATFALACELYIFLFTLSLSSVSANLLARLHRGTISREEIERMYDSRKMVTGRVHRMIGAGFVADDASRLRLTQKAEKLLAFLTALRVFFGHD